MGLFDDIGSFVKNTASDIKNVGEDIGGVVNKNVNKVQKGIKQGENFVRKGVKKELVKTQRGLKKLGFNKNFGKDFKRGFLKGAQLLQEPQRFIERNDPLAKHLGGFSPLGLVSSFGLAPLTSVGFLEELSVNPDLQKKLKDGDVETILNLTTAPLSFIPGSGSASAKGGKKVVKSIAKNINRFF